MKRKQLVFLVILAVCSCKVFVDAFMEASLRHYETLNKGAKKHVNFDKLRVRKVNRTHYMFLGELEVFQDFGNEYTVTGLIYKMAGNDYKLMPFKLGPNGWCEFVEKQKDLYKEFQKVSDFPDVGVCPWPKKVYTLHGFSIGSKDVPPVLGFGDYKMQLQVKIDEVLVNGFNLFINIITLV